MHMLNIWVATPTQQSGWGVHHRGKSSVASIYATLALLQSCCYDLTTLSYTELEHALQFHADDNNDMNKPIALPLARARGVIFQHLYHNNNNNIIIPLVLFKLGNVIDLSNIHLHTIN